jgi:hypothetical protein
VQARGASKIRIATAVAVATVSAISIFTASAATGGPAALRPDLVTLAIQRPELALERDGERALLRITNEIANLANGPLEIFPSAGSANCDADGEPGNDRDASQRIFADSNGSGAYEVDADPVYSERRVGCMSYHPAHDHWHVLDIARYALRREATGKLAARSRKVGFCLTDTRQVLGGAGSPAAARYPLGSGNSSGCDAASTQGVSPGWADVYAYLVPGQSLDVTEAARGHYCLTSDADPLDLVTELAEDNNLRRVKIALRPGKLRVRKLDGPCRV